MAGKALTKDTIKSNTIKKMRRLGVYKPEYDDIIDIYSELTEQYRRLTKIYRDDGFEYSTTTADGGEKKNPIVATLESLRKDILQYSDRLCLNPRAANEGKSAQAPEESGLAKALRAIG